MKDEPNFIDFQLNKNILEEWLVKIKLRDDRDYFTYKKLNFVPMLEMNYFNEEVGFSFMTRFNFSSW